MSKADKMFEELGYKKSQDDVCVLYEKEDEDIDALDVVFYFETENIFIDAYDVVVDKKELKAIAEKAKEIGWL